MTNNQLTKEWLQQTIAELESVRDEIPFGIDTNSELELAAFKMALAAMDSEPVAWRYRTTDLNGNPNPGWSFSETEDLLGLYHPLYRHAQPAPVTEREPIAWLNDAYLARGIVDGEAGSEDAGPGYIPVYREAQPAPVVPDAATAIRACLSEFPESARDIVEECADIAENACRAAMLQAEPVTTANKLGNSPVIPDGWKLVPVEPNGDMLAAAQDAYGETDGDIASTLRAAMLAAAQPAPTIQVTDAMAYAFHHALTDGPLGDEDVEDIKAGLRSAFANATANQPTLVLPDDYQNLSELYHALEKRLFKIAQRIKGTSFDKYAHTPSQAIDVLEESLFGEDDITRRATMLAVSPPAPKSTVK